MISEAKYLILLAKGLCEFEFQLTQQPQFTGSEG